MLGLVLLRHFWPILLVLVSMPEGRADDTALPGDLTKDAGRLGYFADAVRQKKAVKVIYYRCTAGEEKTASWLEQAPVTKAITDQGAQIQYVYSAPEGKTPADSIGSASALLAEHPDLFIIDTTMPEHADAGALKALEGLIRAAWIQNPRMALVLVYSPSDELQQRYKNRSIPSTLQERSIALYYHVAEIEMLPPISAAEISGTWRDDEIFDDGFSLASRGYELYGKTLSDKLVPCLNWSVGDHSPPILPPPLN